MLWLNFNFINPEFVFLLQDYLLFVIKNNFEHVQI